MLELTHPKVQAAKHAFENPPRGKRYKLSFDYMYGLFCDPTLSFREIARKSERHIVNIIRLFHKVYKPLMSPSLKSTRTRELVFRRRNRRRFSDLVLGTPTESATKIIFKHAAERGLPVRFLYNNKKKPRSRYFMIGDQTCYALLNTRSVAYSKQSERKHFAFTISKKSVESVRFIFLIAKTANREDIYIFKTGQLSQFKGKSKTYYLPDLDTPHKVTPRQTKLTNKYYRQLQKWEIIKAAP